MIKTFSQLKRDLQVGKSLTMVYNSLAKSSELITKRLNIPRKIVKIQTNGIYLEWKEGSDRKSFLELPVASLIEYDDNSIKIYKCGLRDLTDREKSIIDNTPSHRKENKQLAINDALTDGSATYWMDKRYYAENNAGWRWDWDKGLRFDWNEEKMWDKKMKGDLDLQYILN